MNKIELTDIMSKLTKEEIAYWDNYNIESWHLKDKTELGIHGVCRFCGLFGIHSYQADA